ncbi:olfactory receptor 5G9-like [Pyxicephalus adspersus]|uniref:olfactory receptor 5G9-like n=1 Tax=Pyxicephalus adspersus TaxID=30357 RepID=UPI003B593762
MVVAPPQDAAAIPSTMGFPDTKAGLTCIKLSILTACPQADIDSLFTQWSPTMIYCSPEVSTGAQTFDSNLTVITNVTLLGFQGSHLFRIFCFTFFLLIYCVTICGNLLIILLVSYSKNLHTPMYFFLTQLSASDILLNSDIVPNLLHVLLHSSIAMSFSSCITQLFFFILAEDFECFLLTAMSYDRYIAICNPLQYSTIMKHETCIKLVLLSWSLSFLPSLVEALTVYNLWFCGPNVIDHFFCDMEPLLDLSCSDTSIVHLEMFVSSFPLAIFPFSFIIVSYICIIYNILKIQSTTSRQKAFSTCISHLTVVSIFFGTLFFTYIVLSKIQLVNLGKILSVFYTVVIPLLNPIIYSLRNKDIKTALKKSAHVLQVKSNI